MIGCSKEDNTCPQLTFEKIEVRIDYETQLGDAVYDLLDDIYSPLISMTAGQINSSFASLSSVGMFCDSEGLDSATVVRYMLDIEDASNELSSTQSDEYIGAIISDAIKNFSDDNSLAAGEGALAIGPDRPCTDAYVNAINAVGAAMLGCIFMNPAAVYPCVGTAVLGMINAVSNWRICMDNTY